MTGMEAAISRMDDDTLATLLTALLLGWEQAEEIQEEKENTALDIVSFYHGDYMSLTISQLRQVASGYKVKGCWQMRKRELVEALSRLPAEDMDVELMREITGEDHEQEYVLTTEEWVEDYQGIPWAHRAVVRDDWSDATQVYFLACDNPITESEAAQVDKLNRNSLELAPRVDWYSEAKMSIFGDGKDQLRRFHGWIGWIHRNRENKNKLQWSWNRFWRGYYSRKNNFERSKHWLFKKQWECITHYFNSLGIEKRGDTNSSPPIETPDLMAPDVTVLPRRK